MSRRSSSIATSSSRRASSGRCWKRAPSCTRSPRRRNRAGRRPAPRDRRRGEPAAGDPRLGDAAAPGRLAGQRSPAPAISTRASARRSRFARPLSTARPMSCCCAPGARARLPRSRAARERASWPGCLAGSAPRSLARLSHPGRARGRRRGAARTLRRRSAIRPHVLSVRPAPGSPVPGRLERDIDVVRAGLEAGREAMHLALAGLGS